MQHREHIGRAEFPLEIGAFVVLDRPDQIGATQAPRLAFARGVEELRRDAIGLQQGAAIGEHVVGVENLEHGAGDGLERETHPGIIDDGQIVAAQPAGPFEIADEGGVGPFVNQMVLSGGRGMQRTRGRHELIARPGCLHGRLRPGRATAPPVVLGGIVDIVDMRALPLQFGADRVNALAVAVILRMRRRRRHDERLEPAPCFRSLNHAARPRSRRA